MTSSAGNCISVCPSRSLPIVGAMLRMSLVLGPPRISLVIRQCTSLVVGPRIRLVIGPRVGWIVKPPCVWPIVGPSVGLICVWPIVGPSVGLICVWPIVGPRIGFGISPVDGLRILLDGLPILLVGLRILLVGLRILLVGLRISLVIGPRVRLVVGRAVVVGRGYCCPDDSHRKDGSDDYRCDPCLSRRRSGSCQRSSADCRRSPECHQALRHVTLLSSPVD